jgi:hypothetical protein
MPRVEIVEKHWTPEERAKFNAARRSRNILLLAAMGGFCVLIYLIALVKLHEYGQMW